jgi:hypothetical protein
MRWWHQILQTQVLCCWCHHHHINPFHNDSSQSINAIGPAPCAAVLVLLLQHLQQSLSLLGSMPPDALVAQTKLQTQALCATCAIGSARIAELTLLQRCCCCCCCCLLLLLPQDLQHSLSLLGSMPPDALVAPNPAASNSLLPSFVFLGHAASARVAASSKLLVPLLC